MPLVLQGSCESFVAHSWSRNHGSCWATRDDHSPNFQRMRKPSADHVPYQQIPDQGVSRNGGLEALQAFRLNAETERSFALGNDAVIGVL